jgi:hypothetical protein
MISQLFLKFIAPRVFPEFLLGPKTPVMFDSGAAALGFQYGHHVKTIFDVTHVEDPPVDARRADDLALFEGRRPL